MKAHIAVDCRDSLIHGIETTAANANDLKAEEPPPFWRRQAGSGVGYAGIPKLEIGVLSGALVFGALP